MDRQIQEALAGTDPNDDILVVSPKGEAVSIPRENLPRALAKGYRLETGEETQARVNARDAIDWGGYIMLAVGALVAIVSVVAIRRFARGFRRGWARGEIERLEDRRRAVIASGIPSDTELAEIDAALKAARESVAH